MAAGRIVTPKAVNQEDLVRVQLGIAHALKDICAKLDADAGVTDTNYAATFAQYVTLVENVSIKDLGKA